MAVTPWTDPITYPTGGRGSAPFMNTYVKDNLNFLYRPPVTAMAHASPTTLPVGTKTYIPLLVGSVDTDDWHSTVTNTHRFTVSRAGNYLVHAEVYVSWTGSTPTSLAAVVEFQAQANQNLRAVAPHALDPDRANLLSPTNSVYLFRTFIINIAAADWFAIALTSNGFAAEAKFGRLQATWLGNT